MSLGDITWADVTAMVALYGAVLSTIIAVREWKAKRPDIRVEVSEGRVQLSLDAWSEPMIFINAVNAGQKVVTLAMVGVLLPDGQRIVFPIPSPYVTFPYVLLPESPCKAFTPAAKLAANLKAGRYWEKVSIIGYYDDEVGRRHKSKPTIFDTETAKLAS